MSRNFSYVGVVLLWVVDPQAQKVFLAENAKRFNIKITMT